MYVRMANLILNGVEMSRDLDYYSTICDMTPYKHIVERLLGIRNLMLGAVDTLGFSMSLIMKLLITMAISC